MNRIAIVSNGPSATLYDPAPTGGRRYDTVIGVNWTVERWPCDFWVFCDWQTFATCTRPDRTWLWHRGAWPLPTLFHKKNLLAKLQAHCPDAYGDAYVHFPERRIQEDVDIWQWPFDRPRWNCFSGTAALGLAYALQPDVVDVYGVDLEGATDWRGAEDRHNRSEDRWQHERRIWDHLVEILQSEDIWVVRMTPEGAVCSA